jgi:hypothetical protein
MPTKQGSLDLLNDPIAQELLQAPFPMRLAYTWTDGTPRVVPIGFLWNGSELVSGGFPNVPKMKALAKNPKVAVTIDTERMPCHVLLIRGTASVTVHDGIIPEYAAYCKRYMGEEGGNAWVQQLTPIAPKMARIAIKPEWVGIMDFEKRFPNNLEAAMGF